MSDSVSSPNPAPVLIARDGQELGSWLESDVGHSLAAGDLLATDYFWRDGESTWRPLSELVAGGLPPLLSAPPADVETASLEKDSQAKDEQIGLADLARRARLEIGSKRRVNLASPTLATCVGLPLVGLASIALGISVPAVSVASIPLLARWSFVLARRVSGLQKRLICVSGVLLVLTHFAILAAREYDFGSLLHSVYRRVVGGAMSPPNRTTFEKRLASVQMRAEKGQIVIVDSAGGQLVLRIQADLESYSIVTNFDPTGVKPEQMSSPGDQFHIIVRTVEKAEWTLYSSSPNGDSEQERTAMREAINTMIDWSISLADNRISRLDRTIVSEGEGESYVFHGNLDTGTFQLVHESRDKSPGAIQALNAGGTLGSNTGITTFERAHLWKHVFDHLQEILASAKADYDVQRSELEQRQAQERKSREEAQDRTKATEAEKMRVQHLEQDKTERLFPRPNQ